MVRIPERLTNDAIVEAVFELRFEATSLIPDLVTARLADRADWSGYRQARLPFADLPQPIREHDPNLRFQPLMELKSPKNDELIKIGPNVISLHNLAPYLGWHTGFQSKIHSLIDYFYLTLNSPSFVRAGLRYLNALTHNHHHISSINELNIEISINRNALKNPFNLNFQYRAFRSKVVTRISSPEFVRGTVPQDMAAFIDIDVASETPLPGTEELKEWLEEAHAQEKQEFFGLLPEEVVTKLEDTNV